MSIRDRDIWIAPDGTIRYLEYSDFVLNGLGEKRTRRLSKIEWDEAARHWDVIDFQTGTRLGSFATRELALQFEYAHYRNVAGGDRP